MRTGSRSLWALAELAHVVPAPPDPVLAQMLVAWWDTGPRHYGCRTAREIGTGTIVAPSPDLWCADCAVARFATERRCCYCHGRTRPGRANELVFELGGGVTLLARCHRHCSERAGRMGGATGMETS
jgi:hypothetical protein